MRITAMLAALVVLAQACATTAAPSREADEQAIGQALANWLEAWETRDAELAARDYAEDADWTNAFGMTRRGRAEIQAVLEQVFALDFVMAGDTTYPPPEIRFVARDVALVRTSAERVGQQTADGDDLGVRLSTHLRVFERRDGGWVIVSHLISDARSREGPEH